MVGVTNIQTYTKLSNDSLVAHAGNELGNVECPLTVSFVTVTMT